MSISNASLTTVPANIYVSSGNTVVSTMYFCNTGSTATFNLYLVPAVWSGLATANANVQIYNSIQLAAGDTYVLDWEKLVLGSGDQIRANASANVTITATISYVGI